MQDIDFLKNNRLHVWPTLLLWLLPVIILLVFVSISTYKSYFGLLEVKSNWHSHFLQSDAENNSELFPHSPDRQYQQNDYLESVLNYFSHVNNENITITNFSVNKTPSIKVSGEAKDMDSLSEFINMITKSSLFEQFGGNRLSVRQVQSKNSGIRWSIEWLK